MKRKTRKDKTKITTNQGKKYPRNVQNYDYDFPSNINSMDYYKQHHRVYSKYKYMNTSIRRPIKANKNKISSRPVSPVLGSEEYMKQKIEQTSAIIMRQLLNPDEHLSENVGSSSNDNEGISNEKTQTLNEITESTSINNKSRIKKCTIYNIDEIYEKIMIHIANLKEGKKKNLINCNISGYDNFIKHIHKQKRLEISQALRAVCSNTKGSEGSSDFINSIIPDMGIKIEDLPREIIEQLSKNLDLDPEWSCSDLYTLGISHHTRNVLNSPENNNEFAEICTIKVEVPDNSDIYIKPEPSDDFIQNENKSEVNNTNNDKNLECEQINNVAIQPNIIEEIGFNCNNSLFENHNANLGNMECNKSNDVENPLVNIKKEICEQLEFEHCDSHEVYSNRENGPIVVTKEIGHDDTEGTSCIIQENMECVTEKGDAEQNSNSLLTSLTPIEKCNVNKEVNNQCKEFSKNESHMEMQSPVKVMNKETVQNNLEANKKSDCSCSTSTQTEESEIYSPEKFIDTLLTTCYKTTPNNISEAISRMCEIDQCVLKLTNYRQSLFTTLNLLNKYDEYKTCSQKIYSSQNQTVKSKKRKRKSIMICSRKKRSEDVNSIKESKTITNTTENTVVNNCFHNINEKDANANCGTDTVTYPSKELSNSNNTNTQSEDNVNYLGNTNCRRMDKCTNQQYLEMPDIHEKILVIKILAKKLVAGTESGKIIFYNLETGHYDKILKVSNAPITSLLFIHHDHCTTFMCVGSLDTDLKMYNFHNYSMIEKVPLYNRIQCMEYNWGYIFIGCKEGNVLRYKVKKKRVEFEDKFSDSSILVLKTALEGARRVLLVGSRNSPVCIRDAMTGLYMRTMENIISPTVYSLIFERNLVYCGTTNHDILIYSFHDGKLIHRHRPSDSKGIGCMKIDRNLLFASCHNGNIYVYDIKKHKFISTITGPGGVIISMEIFENQVIIGTMSFKFTSLLIPQDILRHKV